MSLISLVYVSYETRRMMAEDIQSILDSARRFNGLNAITGMLLYRKGYFIQALEGEQDVVKALYEKIAADPRHQGCLTVHTSIIQERSFSRWSMGYKDLEGIAPEKLEDYDDFLQSPITPDTIEKGNRVKALLEIFREEIGY